MRITPQKYAQALANTLDVSEDHKATIGNFLSCLRRRKQFRLLPKIIQAFEQEWHQRRGVLKMRVFYPSQFPASIRELERNLSEKLGKKLKMEANHSDTLIGGFRIQMDDMLIDSSIEGMLKDLEHRLNNL